MKDGVHATDVGQEGIPQTLTFMSSFNQTSNIHYTEMCRDFAENKPPIIVSEKNLITVECREWNTWLACRNRRDR